MSRGSESETDDIGGLTLSDSTWLREDRCIVVGRDLLAVGPSFDSFQACGDLCHLGSWEKLGGVTFL